MVYRDDILPSSLEATVVLLIPTYATAACAPWISITPCIIFAILTLLLFVAFVLDCFFVESISVSSLRRAAIQTGVSIFLTTTPAILSYLFLASR